MRQMSVSQQLGSHNDLTMLYIVPYPTERLGMHQYDVSRYPHGHPFPGDLFCFINHGFRYQDAIGRINLLALAGVDLGTTS